MYKYVFFYLILPALFSYTVGCLLYIGFYTCLFPLTVYPGDVFRVVHNILILIHCVDPLEKGMANHSSIVAWRIPMEPDGLQYVGSQRARHD